MESPRAVRCTPKYLRYPHGAGGSDKGPARSCIQGSNAWRLGNTLVCLSCQETLTWELLNCGQGGKCPIQCQIHQQRDRHLLERGCSGVRHVNAMHPSLSWHLVGGPSRDWTTTVPPWWTPASSCNCELGRCAGTWWRCWRADLRGPFPTGPSTCQLPSIKYVGQIPYLARNCHWRVKTHICLKKHWDTCYYTQTRIVLQLLPCLGCRPSCSVTPELVVKSVNEQHSQNIRCSVTEWTWWTQLLLVQKPLPDLSRYWYRQILKSFLVCPYFSYTGESATGHRT